MIHIEYSQNNRAGYLFPNCHEKNDTNTVIHDRIKRYLKEEDYEWAFEFVTTILHHKDYLKIKEELRKTNISDLCEYHDYFQILLDHSQISNHFLDILIDFNQIRRKTNTIISHMLHIDINSDTMDNPEDIQYTLNLFGYYLFQDDSPIITEIQEKYLEEVKEYQKNGVLNSIIQVELSNIKKKTFELYRNYVKKYDTIIAVKKKMPMHCHVNDSYAKHLRYSTRDYGRK